MIEANPKVFFSLLAETAASWLKENVPRLGASLAYYTLLSIAPLFVITLAISSFVFGEQSARGELEAQLTSLVGPNGARALESAIAAANQPKAGILATCIAVIMLFIGAMGVFVELQDALNILWNVKPTPGNGFKRLLKERLSSFAIVLGIGFVLLVSLVINAALSALGKFMSGMLPGQAIVWEIIEFSISLVAITVLFGMIFKILPDVTIPWRDVSVGAFLTAILFNIGKSLFGLYIGRSSIASAYGAAGSFVIILLWVYYSAQILLFGAKFTQIRAARYGTRREPKSRRARTSNKHSTPEHDKATS